MIFVGDLIDELKDISSDCLEEIQFVFQRYGVDAEIIDEHLDIDLDMMVNFDGRRTILFLPRFV